MGATLMILCLMQRTEIRQVTHRKANDTAHFVDELSEGVATVAAAFYPREVVLRFSDFKVIIGVMNCGSVLELL